MLSRRAAFLLGTRLLFCTLHFSLSFLLNAWLFLVRHVKVFAAFRVSLDCESLRASPICRVRETVDRLSFLDMHALQTLGPFREQAANFELSSAPPVFESSKCNLVRENLNWIAKTFNS